MNKKHFYKRTAASLLVFIALFTTVSCEEFLEEQPSTLIDSGYVYNTEAGLQSGVVSLYNFNRDRYDINEQDYMGGVQLSSMADLTLTRSGYVGTTAQFYKTLQDHRVLALRFRPSDGDNITTVFTLNWSCRTHCLSTFKIGAAIVVAYVML